MAITKNVGKILRCASIPCAASPQFWIEMAAPAALNLLWTIITPDKKEDVRLLTGKSWLKNVKQYVKDAEAVTPEYYDGALRAMFTAAEWADMAIWWWFVASLVSEFVADWTSAVFKAAGCDPNHRKQAFSAINPIGGCPADGNWYGAFSWERISPPPIGDQGCEFTFPPGETGSIMASCECVALIGASGPFSLRLRDTESNEVLETKSVTLEQYLAGQTPVVMAAVRTTPFAQRTIRLEFMAPYPGETTVMVATKGHFSGFYGQGGNWL